MARIASSAIQQMGGPRMVTRLVFVSVIFLAATITCVEAQDKKHPSIFIHTGNLSALRARYKEKPDFSGKCSATLDAAKEAPLPGRNLSTQAAALEVKSFAYLVQEEQDAALLQNIKSSLVPYLDTTNFDEIFSTARFLRAVSIVYDWCYDGFTPEERKKVGELLVRLSKKIYDYQRKNDYNNQLYVVTSQLIYPAIALRGEEGFEKEAEKYLKDVEILLKEHLIPASNQVASSGGWHEGIPYATFLAERFVPVLEAWRVYTGENLFTQSAFCKNLATTLVYTRVPNEGFAVPYGAVRYPARWSGASEGVIMPLLAARYHDPLAVYVQKESSQVAPTYWWPYLLWADEAIKPVALETLPLCRFFEGTGAVAMRSDWTDKATYAYFTCGPYYGSHQHWDDNNSFYIYKEGELASDPGGLREQSGTAFHNTLLIGGPQRPQDTAERMRYEETEPWKRFDRGNIASLKHGQQFTYVRGDASKSYPQAKTVYRDFLFVRPCYFIILDAVETMNPGTKVEWLMHSKSAPEESGNRFIVKNNSGKLFVSSLLPDGAKHSSAVQEKDIVCTSVASEENDATHLLLHFLQTQGTADKDPPATPNLSKEGNILKLSWKAGDVTYEVDISPTEGLMQLRSRGAGNTLVLDQLLRYKTSDFEDGTDQGWTGGTIVEGGKDSGHALQCVEIGKPMRWMHDVQVNKRTVVYLDLYIDKPMSEVQFFGRSDGIAQPFRYMIRDYVPGQWVPVKIKLSRLFTWEGLFEPVGQKLEHIAVWPQGPQETVVKIDNVRVIDEPDPNFEPVTEKPGATGTVKPETF